MTTRNEASAVANKSNGKTSKATKAAKTAKTTKPVKPAKAGKPSKSSKPAKPEKTKPAKAKVEKTKVAKAKNPKAKVAAETKLSSKKKGAAAESSLHVKTKSASKTKNHKEKLSKIHDFVEKYRVTDGKSFKLSNYDPDDTGPFDKATGKAQAKALLEQGIELLAEKQDMLYAQDRYAMLLVFQAMDAAGKDGTIKHVMSGVNPQGCQVYSFKQPSDEDLDHDYMWRYQRCLPERGRIGIYNRSYYEEVLVVRVHDSILGHQKLPKENLTKNIWKERLEDIASFERYLGRNGYRVVKFFLNVSKKEQKRRFIARLELPEKHWKFSMSDINERAFWNDYMSAYTEAIRATATKDAPWYIVPADNKWFSRVVVAAAIVDTLNDMHLHYPEVDEAKMRELEEARGSLLKASD